MAYQPVATTLPTPPNGGFGSAGDFSRFSDTPSNPVSEVNLMSEAQTGKPAAPTIPVTPATAGNSASNIPSSSATASLNANAANTVTDATNPPPPIPLSDAMSYYSDYYGMSEDDVRNYASTPEGRKDIGSTYSAYQNTQQQATAANEKYQAQVLQNDAAYQTDLTKIQNEAASSLGSFKAASNAANPYSVSSTTSTGAAKISANFQTLSDNYTKTYLAAQAAALADNDTAVAQLWKDYNTTAEGIRKDTADIINQQETQQRITEQNQATEKAAQQKIADTELQNLPQGVADEVSKMDPNNLSAQNLAVLKGTPGYNALISAGFTPADAVGYINSAAVGNKMSIAQTKANISLTLEQLKLTEDQDAMVQSSVIANAPGGTAYLSAIQAAQAAGNYSASKNKATVQGLSDAVSSGDFNGAKNLVTNYVLSGGGSSSFTSALSSLKTVSGATAPLIARLKTLPISQQPGFWNGNIQSLATKLGQNPDPQLQQIGTELTHINAAYARALLGLRGANTAAGGKGPFSDLLGSSKDSTSLTLTDLQAFNNTANDLLNSQVSSTIGQDNFNTIYGSGGVLGSTKPNVPPVKGATQTYNGSNYSFDGTQWVKAK